MMRQILSLCLILWLFCSQIIPCLAQTAAPVRTNSASPGRTPVNLDLSSTVASQKAGRALSNGPVVINMNGKPVSVTSTTALTSAQKVAVMQVIHSGQQLIQLGAQGNATGGQMFVGSRLAQHLASLVVPHGVTVIDRASLMNLTGNLTNAGAFYAVSSSNAVTTAGIRAANIINQPGGLISTVLPSGGLTGVAGAITNLNLSLYALSNVINAGVISSSGSLNLTAGSIIANTLSSGSTAAPPLMQAMNNVSLQAASLANQGVIVSQLANVYATTANLQNAGTIESIRGNINLNALPRTVLNVDNTKGTMQALQGAINIHDAGYNATDNAYISGGNLLSQALNINAGNGSTYVDVQQLSGAVNASGYGAHVTASTDVLNLGNINVVDPTFYNDGSNLALGGDINITGPITANEPIAIVASGNIYSTYTATPLSINSTGTGDLGNITLVAGAAIDTHLCSGCSPVKNISGSTGNVPSESTITILGASLNGGNIDFTGATQGSSIITTGNNITMVAFSGLNSNANGAVVYSGAGSRTLQVTGPAAQLTVIAGGVDQAITNHKAIELGTVSTRGTLADNAVSVFTSQPSAGSGVTIDSTGAIIAGKFTPTTITANSSISVSGAIRTGADSGCGRAVTMTAGSAITTGAINTSASGTGDGGNISLNAGSGITTLVLNTSATSGISGGAVNLVTTSGSISTRNIYTVAGSGDGGTVNLSATDGDITVSGSGTTIDTRGGINGSGRNGGAVISTAGSSVTVPSISTASGSPDSNSIAAAGVVNIAAGQNISVDSIDTDANYGISGGAVTLKAGQNISIGSIGTIGNIQKEGIFTESGTVTISSGGYVDVTGAIGTSYVGTTGTSLCTTCNGGAVSIAAVNYAHTAAIVTNALSSAGSTPGNNGGSVTISASQDIVTGQIDAWGGSGNGGTITLIAGTNINNSGVAINSYAAGAAGTGNGGAVTLVGSTVASGKIDADGVQGAAGGAVTIAATTGSVTSDSIFTAGGSASGGSVGISAAGTVTVNGISAYSKNSYAGNIYVSSGAASFPAINAGQLDTSSGIDAGSGSIFLGAANNSSGTNGFALANSYIAYATASTQTIAPTPSRAYLFYNNTLSNPGTISFDTTIHVTTGANGVNIYPGIYASDIGTSALPVNLTLDLGGDSRTIVPLSSAGNIYLSSFHADNTVGGKVDYQNNGYQLTLIAGGATGIVLTGTLSASSFAGSGTSGNLYLLSMAKASSVTQKTGSLFWTANNIIVRSGSGGLNATSPNNVLMNAGGDIRILANINLASGSSTTNGNVALSSASAILVTGDITDANSDQGSGGAVTLTADTSITTGKIDTRAMGSAGSGGMVTLSAGDFITTLGDIETDAYSGSDISGGAVTLTAGGSITTGGNIITAGGKGGNADIGGGVTITAGSYIVSRGYIVTEGFSTGGKGGNVILSAGGAGGNGYISTGEIDTDCQFGGALSGGDVTITAGTSINITSYDGVYAIITTGGTGSGGKVTLCAANSINTNGYEICTTAGRGGSGGDVTLSAGNGYISAGEIDTNAYYQSGVNGVNGGSVSLSAASFVSLNSVKGINALITNGGSGNGGSVIVMAGSSIDIGGGVAQAVDTHASTGNGGSIALVAGDFISAGNLATYTTSPDSTNYAGNIFVSSGSSSGGSPLPALFLKAIDSSTGTGTLTGNIFLGANNFTDINGIGPSAQSQGYAIQYNVCTTCAGSQTPRNPYLFYGSGAGDISTGLSVVYPSQAGGTVNIQPGFYTAIGSAANPVNLTLDLGGDSRTIVPLSAAGNIYLSGLNIKHYATVTGSGYTEAILSGAAADTGLMLSGNVNDPSVSNAGINRVHMYALGAGSLNDDAVNPGIIYGNELSLFAPGGQIGVPGNVVINTPSITAAAFGNVLLDSRYSGDIIVNEGIANNRGFFNLSSPGNIVTAGPLVAYSILVNNTGAAGNISINAPAIGSFVEMDTSTSGTFVLSSLLGGASTIVSVSSQHAINSGTMLCASSGGKIVFSSPTYGGPVQVENNGLIIATAGSALVGFTGAAGVTVANNGIIESLGTSGIVGFNSSGTGALTVTGTGTIAGEQVNFGNLDLYSLQIQTPFVTVNPFSGHFVLADIAITQGSINGTMQVSGSIIPPSPTPYLQPGSSALASWLSWLISCSFFHDQTLARQNLLSELIGTRIATDYTPWTTYPQLNPFTGLPLQGNITIERLASSQGAIFAGESFTSTELATLAGLGILYGPLSQGNFFDLLRGSVLFMPRHDITIQTREGTVTLPAGTIALILETGHDVAIYNLHSNVLTGSIKVTAGKNELTLSPGRQILLTRNMTSDFYAINPGSNIGCRNVGKADLGDGIRAYMCDFSIGGSMMNMPVIHNLVRSNDPAHKKAAWKMIKNAALLADLTGAAGPYKTRQ